MRRAALTVVLLLIERYGLDGNAPRSLEEVAARYGLTRLQLREVEGRFLQAARVVLREAGPEPGT